MRRFQRILVVPVTSGAEPPSALHEAVALAASSGASVEILGHLADAPPCEDGIDEAQQALFRDAYMEAYRRRLQDWTERVGAADLPIHIASGSLLVDVIERVGESGHDLVVVAGDGSVASATTASQIMRTCPCPVWLLRPEFTGTRVLAAIDPDHSGDRNRLILELAHSQAALHDGELRVVHAWDLPGLDALYRDDSALDRAQLTSITSAIETAHRTSFRNAIEAVDLTTLADTHLVEGPAAQAIHGLTALYRIDLIVVGAGAWGHPGLGLGSTAEQVLAEADCSVLVVREPSAAA